MATYGPPPRQWLRGSGNFNSMPNSYGSILTNPISDIAVRSILGRNRDSHTHDISSGITSTEKGRDLIKSCPPQIQHVRENTDVATRKEGKEDDITRRKPTKPKNMFELLRKQKSDESSKKELELAGMEDKHDDSDDGETESKLDKGTIDKEKESLSDALYYMLSGIDEKTFTREAVDVIHTHLCGYCEGITNKKNIFEARMDRYNEQIRKFCTQKSKLDSSIENLESRKERLRYELEDLDRELLISRGKAQHTSKKIAKRRENIRKSILPKIRKLEELENGGDKVPLDSLFDFIREQNAKGKTDIETLKHHGFEISLSDDNVEIKISPEILGNRKNSEDYNRMRSHGISDEVVSVDSSVEDSDFDEEGYLSALNSKNVRGTFSLMEKYAEEIKKRYPLSYGGTSDFGYDYPSIRREYTIPSASNSRQFHYANIPTYPSYYTQTQDNQEVGITKVHAPPIVGSTKMVKGSDIQRELDGSTSSISSESSSLSSSTTSISSGSSSLSSTTTSEDESEETKARKNRKYIRRRRKIEKLRRESSFVKEVGNLLNGESAEGCQESEIDYSKRSVFVYEDSGTCTLDKRNGCQTNCECDNDDCNHEIRDNGKSLELDRKYIQEEEESIGRFDSTILNGSLCISCGRWDKSAYFDKSVRVKCGDSCTCADCGEERERCECPWFFTEEMLLLFQDYNYDFGTRGNKTFPQAVNVRKREFKKRPWLKECNLRDIWKMLKECFDKQSTSVDPADSEEIAENIHMYSLIWKNWLRRFVMQKERYGRDNFRVLVTIVYMIMELRLVCKEDPTLSPNFCTYCHLPFGPKKRNTKKSASRNNLSNISVDSASSSQSMSIGAFKPRARSSKTNNLCASCKNFTGDRFVKKYNWVVEAMSLFHTDFGDRLTTKKREKLANIVKQAKKDASFWEVGERTMEVPKKSKGKKRKKKSRHHKHFLESKTTRRNIRGKERKKARKLSNEKASGNVTDT